MATRKSGDQITHVPVEGGSGRVPTGAMQFRNDWPGLFVRGDAAIPIANAIRRIEKHLVGSEDLELVSSMRFLREIADVIERDVMVSKDVE